MRKRQTSHVTEFTNRKRDRTGQRGIARTVQTMLAYKVYSFPLKIKVAYTTILRCKSSLKLFYIEHRVDGNILGAGTVLYMAGSLRYRRIKHP